LQCAADPILAHAFDAHFHHVEEDAAADVSADAFDPVEIAEQCAVESKHLREFGFLLFTRKSSRLPRLAVRRWGGDGLYFCLLTRICGCPSEGLRKIRHYVPVRLSLPPSGLAPKR